MTLESARRFPEETGGVLLGYSDESGFEIVIEHAIGPGPEASHARTYFLPDQNFHEQEIARIYSTSGRMSTYLGDWHSHPAGGAYLSKTDRKTLERISRAETARFPRPLMALLAGPEWEITIWRGSLQPTLLWGRSLSLHRCNVVLV